MSKIVDGYTGKPNIFPDVIGEHNISMYGSGDYVLPVGECLGYELISNNEIHIKDGLFVTQGRRGYIEKGTTDVCIIENGAQAVNRNDLIVIEYAKDETTMLESHTTKVIKGTAGEKAVDPEIVTGDIPNGAVLHQMPLYRVKIEGLNIVAVEQMFEIGSVAAETVDPMVATEPGFAADAYQTKLQFDEQNKNLNMRYNPESDMVEILHNNEWINWKMGNLLKCYIFYHSDQTDITLGWQKVTYNAGSVVINTDNISLSSCISNDDYSSAIAYTVNKIDFTNYSKLYVKLSRKDANNIFFVGYTDSTPTHVYASAKPGNTTSIGTITSTETAAVFDISDVIGEHRLVLNSANLANTARTYSIIEEIYLIR